MSETDPLSRASSARPVQEANSVTPTPVPRRGRQQIEPPQAELALSETPTVSHRLGDTPASLTRRYFTEPRRGGAALAFYEGPGAKRVAFTDHGAKLTTSQTHPAVARDLAVIAAHRGWSRLAVVGEDEFRREVWLEASARGLAVKGYRPTARDKQELDARQKGRSGEERRGDPIGEPSAGVATGRLLASGVAPYRRRPGGDPTPYIRLDVRGRTLDVWGKDLPEALAQSDAKIGDRVRVRRDGVERLGAEAQKEGAGSAPNPPGRAARTPGAREAARFLSMSTAAAARDPNLQGAQSHLAVLDAVINQAVSDPARRKRLQDHARRLLAQEIAQGRTFRTARVREVEPPLARDIDEGRRREADRATRR